MKLTGLTGSEKKALFIELAKELYGADFKYVNFEGANLKNVNFRGVKIENADFTNADLKDVDFTKTKINSRKGK